MKHFKQYAVGLQEREIFFLLRTEMNQKKQNFRVSIRRGALKAFAGCHYNP